jgi:signal peptidase II
MWREQPRRFMPLLAGVLSLAFDQLSKQWALDKLPLGGPSMVLPGPISFTLVFNRSNAFGLVPVAGELTRWGLTAIDLLVAAVLTWVLVRRSATRLNTVGLALIIAGAIGNTWDRISFGAVIDFIDASKLGFVWVFNVADASIDHGIGLLVFETLLMGQRSDR